MIDSIVLEEMLIPNHNITVKTTPTTNPNDRESTKAVKLDFYDDDKKIGIAYISAIDTNNGFIYNLEVYKKYRGNGYANDIMNYILKCFTHSHIYSIHLSKVVCSSSVNLCSR